MNDSQVLSREEVDALLKASQDKTFDISQAGTTEVLKPEGKVNSHALANITELVRTELEKILSAFFRKKIVIKLKSSVMTPLSNCVNTEAEKCVYSGLHIQQGDRYGIIAMDLAFLHRTINLLYGGVNSTEDTTLESPGKVGVVIAEKVAKLCLEAFAEGCKEYGTVNCELNKTTPMLNLLTNLTMEEQVYFIELSIFFDEIETVLKLMIAEDFFSDFIPPKILNENRHHEKDFWRTAIKTQVVDSIVTVNVTLPDVNLKFKDFMHLKEGDVIPISDPTLVYVCLNNLKLFRAAAAQSNSKMVAKIISQI